MGYRPRGALGRDGRQDSEKEKVLKGFGSGWSSLICIRKVNSAGRDLDAEGFGSLQGSLEP